MKHVTASNVSASRDTDLKDVFQSLSDVRIARIGLTDALRCSEHHLIQNISVITAEKDPDTGANIPQVTSKDFKPVTLSLEDALESLYSFVPPINRAQNSLPRHSGFILISETDMARIALLAKKLNAAKEHFRDAATKFAKHHIFNENKMFKQSDWHPNQTFTREGVFDQENFEMVTRPCYFVKEPIIDFKVSWSTNGYSQPKKLSKHEFIRMLETEEISEFGHLQGEALDLAKKLPYGANVAKRFYLPPYPMARVRHNKGEAWEKNIYLSSPVIITGHDLDVERLKEKATLNGLDVNYTSGTFKVARNGGRKLKPHPDLLHPDLRWYIV